MLRRSFKGVVTQPIHSNVKLSEAPSFSKTVFEFAPTCRGAKDYQQLTRAIIKDNRSQAARRKTRRGSKRRGTKSRARAG
jgi:cellulose biosynthesis protein BcsQ